MKYLIYSILALSSIIGCKGPDVLSLSSPHVIFDIEDALVQGSGIYAEKIKELYDEIGTIAAYDFDPGLAYYAGDYSNSNAVRYTVAVEKNVGEIIDFYSRIVESFSGDLKSTFARKYLLIVDTITINGNDNEDYYNQAWARNIYSGKVAIGGAGAKNKDLFLDSPTLSELYEEDMNEVLKRPRRIIRGLLVKSILFPIFLDEQGIKPLPEFMDAFGKMDHLVYNDLTVEGRVDYLKNTLRYGGMMLNVIPVCYNANTDGTLRNSDISNLNTFETVTGMYLADLIGKELLGCGIEWSKNFNKAQQGTIDLIDAYIEIFKTRGIDFEKLGSEETLKFSTDVP